MWLSCDFETLATKECIEKGYTYVWGWGSYHLETDTFLYGNSIDNFFETIYNNYKLEGEIDLYFHNLKFDGSFILNWLENNGYNYVEKINKSCKAKKVYTTLVSGLGTFYNITFYYKFLKLSIKNSLNLINRSVAQIAKSLKLDTLKGEIDYTLHREENHCLSNEEIEYLKNDVIIVAKGLYETFFKKGMNKMTVGSNALAYFKKNTKNYTYFFPQLNKPEDTLIREAYRGGYVYINKPSYTSYLEINKKGCVYDFNSMYPSVMLKYPLPLFYPIRFEGKPDGTKNLAYVIKLECKFKLKEELNVIPTIQIKNSLLYNPNEYITDSGCFVELTLTHIDFYHMLRNYDVQIRKYIGGYYFHSKRGIFDNYINEFAKLKQECKGVDEGGYMLAKLLMNSLTGKFATSPKNDIKIPYLYDGVLGFKTEISEKNTEYIPVTTFITAYARHELFTTIYKNFNNFLYCDTDSVHLSCPKEEAVIENIHKTKFGCWDCEFEFNKARYIKPKCYYEENENERVIKTAGLSHKYAQQLDWDSFKLGTCLQVLKPKQVKGGVVLVKSIFEIK